MRPESPRIPLTYEHQARFAACRDSIEQALKESPSAAFRLFKDAIKDEDEIVRSALLVAQGSRFDWIAKASRIREGASALPALATEHGNASRAQRRLLARYAVAELIALAVSAGQDASARVLDSIAEGLVPFVLEGTVAQELVCKLAIQIGLLDEVPPELLRRLGQALVDALVVVLEVGAPATRDSAVEGLGAILKSLPDLAARIPELKGEDDPGLDTSARTIKRAYVRRRQRQRLIALAIADFGDYRARLFREIQNPTDFDIDHRAHFLRILPAVLRQSRATSVTLNQECVESLRNAALMRSEARSGEDRLHFAAFMESVFQTISVMIDRHVDPRCFDDVVESALRQLSPTLFGTAAENNAYVRATVRVIDTASRIAARLHRSRCANALRRVYEELAASHATPASLWANPGILEGCFLTLPSLLARIPDRKWLLTPLETVFEYLEPASDPDDVIGVHRRICANRCFRRLLIALMEVKHSARHEDDGGRAYEPQPDDDDAQIVAELLSDPTPLRFLNAFRTRSATATADGRRTPEWSSPLVIGAADFDAEVRRRLPALFATWEETTEARKLLLTRLLANQLRTLSHDERRIAWFPALQERLNALPGHVADDAHVRSLMEALSNIPSDAADAVDSDLQDFLRHRSRRSTSQAVTTRDSNDLPPYVLAMIDETVSYRLATDIAREVDLSVRRARLDNPKFDIAILLYHVMLHGPDRAIFFHLLPRVKGIDCVLVSLFADHVHAVRSCGAQEATYRGRAGKLLAHVRNFLPKLRRQNSELLTDLCNALDVYAELADEKTFWLAIQGNWASEKIRKLYQSEPDKHTGRMGGFHLLLRRLDDVARRASLHLKTPSARDLAMDCEDDCAALLGAVRHYIELPIQHFDERRSTMEQAVTFAERLNETVKNHGALHPPERVMLTTLLESWLEVFRQTIEWFIDAPRRCIETTQPEPFWRTFVTDPTAKAEEQARDGLRENIVGRSPSLFGGQLDAFIDQHFEYNANERCRPQDLGLIGDPPPEKPLQRPLFVRFYVDWMASELDVDHLAWALRGRWPEWFKSAYFIITNFWWCAALILMPFGMAIGMSIVNEPWALELAGLGFFLYSVVLLGVAAVTLTPRIIRRFWQSLVYAARVHATSMVYAFRENVLREEVVHKSVEEQVEEPSGDSSYEDLQYMYQSMLPRLLRLIVVPLALIVDLEHSYYFPLHASNVVILLLMALAFFTTHYFVTLEVLRRRGEEVTAPMSQSESRGRVTKIVSVALAHSFALSLVFSIIFESNMIRRVDEEERHISRSEVVENQKEAPRVSNPTTPVMTSARVPPAPPEPTWAASLQELGADGLEKFRSRFDREDDYFFGLLPRRTSFDLGKVTDRLVHFATGRQLHDSVVRHLRFDYYPTLILTWTALGLFFGVFLEGFLKGERLRQKIGSD